MSRRILLDAGNSSLKWAVLDGRKWLAHGRCDYADLSAFASELRPHAACYIASVAAPQHERALTKLMQPAGLSPVWLKASARFGDLANGYRCPEQLGVDRWMAMIASRGRTEEAVLVVSAGTAMTIDAVSAEGQFLGGLILPGTHLMRQAVTHGTAGVAETAGAWQTFPRRTADAVESGIIAALCGAVERQYAALAAAAGTSPRCLLTGGGAEVLLPHLAIPVEHVPLLVLEGLDRVSLAGETA